MVSKAPRWLQCASGGENHASHSDCFWTCTRVTTPPIRGFHGEGKAWGWAHLGREASLPPTERDGYDINSPFTHWVLLSGRECRLNAAISLLPCSENEGKTLGWGHSTGSLIPFCVWLPEIFQPCCLTPGFLLCCRLVQLKLSWSRLFCSCRELSFWHLAWSLYSL